MEVTESGMMMDVSEVQPWNALLLMVVTESGMMIDVSKVQP